MNTNIPMKSEERISLLLRGLYEQYGYAQYKMSKFEEYDLYVSNKDFLISDSVITFTDTNGKLMALKPDMTLSIVKNTKDASGTLSKVYYDENVYRVSKGTHSFKEIKQVGLECIGDVDAYSLYEVLMLAAESLQSISNECVLDISHLGILSGVLESLGVSESVQNDLFRCMGEKNPHELTAFRNLPEGRTRCAPNLPDISHAAVDELARLHSLGRVPENIPESRLLRAVQEDLEMRYTELRPGTPLSYTFTLPAELPDAPTAHFRLSGAPFLGAKDALHLAVDVSCETLPVIRLIPNRLFDTGFTLELPQSHLLPGKTLQLTLHRLDQNEAASVIFQAYHDLHLLLPGIPALCNLARFTFILVLSLALTSALGVSLGCSFSLPVTLFTGVLTLLACSISILSPSISAVDSVSSFWAKVSTFISETLAHPFTDLAELNPLHHLLSGEALPLSVIILFCLRLVMPGLLLCSASSLLSTVKDEDH